MKTTVHGKHGAFVVHDTDKWIGRSLIESGSYSEQEIEFLCSLIHPGDVVVEVGANIGAITVPLAKAVGAKGFVHAFEPHPEIFDLLELNVVNNGLALRTELRQCALGSKRGEMTLAKLDWSKELNSGASELAPSNEARDDVHSVTIATLDSFAFSRQIDLIKIDVEGFESRVLSGAVETIERCKPILFVENDRPAKSRQLIVLLMGLGYRLWWHMADLHHADAIFDGGEYSSANMVCIHRDKPVPESVAGLAEVASEYESLDLALLRRAEKDATNGKPQKSAPVKHVNDWACLVRLGGVGDNLIASSVLPALKRKYGHVEVIAADPQSVVFENNPHIDKLTSLPQGHPPWEDGIKWQEYWVGRAKEYAFFANLSHSCETLTSLTRVQTQYYWPASMRRRMCGQNYLEVVADICETPYDELEPRFYPTDTEIAAAEKVKKHVGGRYIGWVISGSRVDKVWPPAAVVIAQLLKDTGWPIILFGAPGRDFEIAKQIEAHVKAANGVLGNLHLALSSSVEFPHWPIRRLLSQVLLADILVTPDTGPAWAAAMEKMPKVVMLSHASSENITKRWVNTRVLHAAPSVGCWPCHLLIDRPEDCERLSGRKGEQGAACITSIAPDLVIDAVRKAATL